MMNKNKWIEILAELANRLRQLPEEEWSLWKREAELYNKWFTPDNVQKALDGICSMLQPQNLERWLAAYPEPEGKNRKVGIVMAGNIPLVGFHDLLCTLVAGHTCIAKLSSDDKTLLPRVAALLTAIEPSLADKIVFAERLNGVDAVIATGSDNTARHFDYYFSKVPRIVRRNRVSVAVLTGSETEEERTALGADILQYYGLGCRNVSKLYLPEGYPMASIYEPLQAWSVVSDFTKYSNNYEYNRAVYLLKTIPHLDNGFLIAMESEDLVSPIAVFYYEYYKNLDDVRAKLAAQQEKIQCVVARPEVLENAVPFGEAQLPALWDYADGVDTLKFLLELK
jgi:hypothetical protein